MHKRQRQPSLGDWSSCFFAPKIPVSLTVNVIAGKGEY